MCPNNTELSQSDVCQGDEFEGAEVGCNDVELIQEAVISEGHVPGPIKPNQFDKHRKP